MNEKKVEGNHRMDASQKLRVALIAGPMYDPLYQVLPEFTRLTGIPVEVAFHAVHPELNAHLASLNDVPYHLVSTHTKYAPSQLAFLGALDKAGLEDFFPALIEMTRINGRVYGIPRNIDIKLLHFRRDLVEKVPQTWDELTGMAASLSDRDLYGFVFPGKDSGLFGMFYELAEMGGAHLFPPGEVPKLNNQGGAWALGIIRNLYLSGAVPPENVEWQYDESHRFFRDGHAAMVCDWPGYYGAYCAADSKAHGRFGVARMPQGPLGIHKAYAGSHTFALTKRGTGEPAALDLLKFLTAPDRQWTEAQHGSVPVRRSCYESDQK